MTKHDTDMLFLCDRRKCEHCHPEVCQHTRDISHAVNFVKNEEFGCFVERRADDKARQRTDD